jgi:hypothetical protein
MKIRILIISLFICISVFGQQTKEWLEKIENPEYSSGKLKQDNFKAKYLKYDFSTQLTPKQDFIGFIGQDYRRIRIFFTSLTKDTSDQEKYLIKGISVVGNNICDFKGEISIEQVREYKSMHYGVDNKYENSGIKSQGILIGKYEFKENPEKKHTGIFEGTVTLNWYVDRFGIIHYDRIEWFSDRYRNNQYVGTWTDYKNGTKKICNWGEYRIPFSGDLDIGAGEFSPNEIYLNKDWEDMKIE